MSQDLLRIIDGICREKNIEREGFIADLEAAMVSAIKKARETEEATVHFDPLSGRISATVDGQPIDVGALGRIPAQATKQVMIQRTRERERGSIFEEFSERRGTIISGAVVRVEGGGNLLVNLGRVEGFLPRSEQIPGESHQIGERIRVLVLEVREMPNQVKIILSRANPEFIVRLFEVEVPEVAERVIEIRALAREPGYRTKVAVSSIDSKVDAVGACVGVRGSRIKNIVDELGGEKIDIVRWNESSQILIQNALKPAEVQEIALCLELGKATVVVAEDQLSLAIGKRGQNVRLAARLTGWDIDILTPAEYNKNLETLEKVLRQVEGVDDVILDKLVALGAVSVGDLDELDADPLISNLELSEELANKIVEAAGEEVIRQQEIKEAEERARQEALARGEPWPPVPEGQPEGTGEGESTAEATAETGDVEAPVDATETAPAADAEPSADTAAVEEPQAAAAADETPAPEEAPSAEPGATDDAEKERADA